MLANGQMSIAASKPLEEGGSMIVMCQFDKGLFTPAAQGEGAFAEVRHKAFEGSDYQEELYRERDEDSIPLSVPEVEDTAEAVEADSDNLAYPCLL